MTQEGELLMQILKPEKRQYHNSSLKTWKSPVVGGSPTSHENGTSGAKKPEAGLLYHMWQEGHLHPKILSRVAVDDQMFMEPSQSQPERKKLLALM